MMQRNLRENVFIKEEIFLVFYYLQIIPEEKSLVNNKVGYSDFIFNRIHKCYYIGELIALFHYVSLFK